MFKVTQFEPKTLRWWFSQRSKIDMNPPYQRHGRLWSPTDKAFLVDSIINEYDVPKIYLADFTFGPSKLNAKGLPYAIIDGKQRFEALFDFFEGKLSLDAEFNFQQNTNIKLGGLGYNDLKNKYSDIADIFDNYPLSVMRVITDNEDNINELFVRLNRSKPLTGAEIRNAMAGPAPGIIRSLVTHEIFKSCIKFSLTRGQDKNAAAKILLFEFKDELAETKRRNLDQFTKETKKEKYRLELASRRVIDVMDRMAEIFLPKDILLGSAGIIPVYYWFIRQCNAKQDSIIREFLVEFERKRKETRTITDNSQTAKRTNKDFIEYVAYNRNTNDIASHTGRIDILERQFAKYINEKKKS